MAAPARKAKNPKGTARAGVRTARADPNAGKLAKAGAAYKEALEQQAATSEILRALSRSSTDPQPVLDAIVRNAHRLCGAVFSILYRYDGRMLDVAADSHASAKASRVLRSLYPQAPRRDHIIGRTVLEGRAMHTVDMGKDERFPANRNAHNKLVGFHAALAVPLLREGKAIGVIATGRLAGQPFTKREIDLLQTFADQAAIAIRTADFVREIQERNGALNKSLQFQNATAEILASLSSSVTDTSPVFDAIVRNVLRLFGTQFTAVFLLRGEMLELAALKGHPDFEKRF